MILLDTHVLVWILGENRQLGQRALRATTRASGAGELGVSAISFWEIALLLDQGRLPGQRDARAWRHDALAMGLLELPLSGDIAIRSTELTGLPPDPADRFIVATALIRNATFVTADQKLLGWRGRLKRLDARR